METDNATGVQRALVYAVTNAYRLHPSMRDNDLQLIINASEHTDSILDEYAPDSAAYRVRLEALNGLNAAMLIMSTLRHLRKLEGGR